MPEVPGYEGYQKLYEGYGSMRGIMKRMRGMGSRRDMLV